MVMEERKFKVNRFLTVSLFIILFTNILFNELLLSQNLVSDSTRTKDPLQNRLFFMPTGKIMEEGRISFTTVDVMFMHGAYTPTDFLQIDLSYLLPIGEILSGQEREINIALGSKIQTLQESGFFKGLALGLDIAYTGKKVKWLNWEFPTQDFYYKSIFDELLENNYPRASPLVGSTNISATLEQILYFYT
jgi:hypothetical protein